jgi:hypothetical protein
MFGDRRGPDDLPERRAIIRADQDHQHRHVVAKQAANPPRGPGTWCRCPVLSPSRWPRRCRRRVRDHRRGHRGIAKTKHDNNVTGMLAGLAQTDPAQYEPALTTLGTLLGADAAKPADHGRCDSTWCWQNHLWLAVEAKSDHQPPGDVPHRDIRQANDQLRLLAADRHQSAPPPDSATIIVSPRPTVAPDGITSAEPHVHLTTPAPSVTWRTTPPTPGPASSPAAPG